MVSELEEIAAQQRAVGNYTTNKYRENVDNVSELSKETLIKLQAMKVNFALAIQKCINGAIVPYSFIYERDLTTYYVTYRYAGQGVIAYNYQSITGAAYLIYQTGGLLGSVLAPLSK